MKHMRQVHALRSSMITGILLSVLRGIVEAEFQARFSGDASYCSSMDRAPIALVGLP